MENYLVFQTIFKYFQCLANSSTITQWKSKGLSKESITPPTSDENIPLIIYYTDSAKIRVKLNGSCLKHDKLAFTPKAILNFCIVYKS